MRRLAVLILVLAISSAGPARADRPDFEGECTFDGEWTFASRVTNTMQWSTAMNFTLESTTMSCAGTLNGVPIPADARVDLLLADRGGPPASCWFSSSLLRDGRIRFVQGIPDEEREVGDISEPEDRLVSVHFMLNSVGSEIALVLRGLGSGLAVGSASTYREEAQATLDTCNAAGFDVFHVTGSFRTLVPMWG